LIDFCPVLWFCGPKTVLTLDRFTTGDYGGIEVVNAVDWLLRGTD